MASREIDWAALRAPFSPEEVDFRIQSTFERQGKTTGVVVTYVDARAVQERLDAVCGPDGWAFDWQPVGTSGGTVTAAKGTLTIGGISKSDVGDAGQTEPTKSSVSDALKRAAVMWGIGRYLYDIKTQFAEVEQRGKSWVLAKGEAERLRRELPQPATEETLGRIRNACETMKREMPQGIATEAQARDILAQLTEDFRKARQGQNGNGNGQGSDLRAAPSTHVRP